MIVGDPSVFAIESEITTAYERPSLLALGMFVLHVKGQLYGVYHPDATLMRCSFDEVEQRIACRGKHEAPFSEVRGGGIIADSFLSAVYAEQQRDTYFGISRADFCDTLCTNHIAWAPDGDEAFDDGSYVLQFDVIERVRLIAFKNMEACLHDPSSLGDVWISCDEFYDTLRKWHAMFRAQWESTPKVPDLG